MSWDASEIAFRNPFRDPIVARGSYSPAITEKVSVVFRDVRVSRGRGTQRTVLCRLWILCNETAISNGARSARKRAKCRWIKYPGPLRKKHEKGVGAGERRVGKRGRGTATRHISISLYWLLHNRYTGKRAVRGRSRGCIKVRLIFSADRCGNLLRARSPSAPFAFACTTLLFPCSLKRGLAITVVRV